LSDLNGRQSRHRHFFQRADGFGGLLPRDIADKVRDSKIDLAATWTNEFLPEQR